MTKFASKIPAAQTYLGFVQKIWLAAVLVWQTDWRFSVANVVLIILQAAIPLLLLLVVKSVIDEIVEIDKEAAAAFTDTATRNVAILFVVGAVLAIAQTGTAAAANYVRFVQALKVSDHVRSLLQEKAISADLALFETPQHWDVLHRTRQQAAHRPRTMVEGLLKMAGDGVSFLAMIGVLISFHWLVLPVLVLAVIPGLIRRLKVASDHYSWERDATQEDRYGSYVDQLISSGNAAKELRGFDLGKLLQGWFFEIREGFRRRRQEHAKRRALVAIFSEGILILVVFGLLAFMGFSAVSGTITVGDFVIFFAAMQRASTHVRQIMGSFATLYEDALFVSDFHEIMALKPSVADPPSPKPIPPVPELRIQFDGVSFGYRPAEKMVLEDLSFSIEPGESVAFVGPNGSGKTTLIKLICRFYDPVDGAITLGGTDLRQFQASELRKQFSYMFQDFVHYQMTAHKNVWLGDHTELIDLEHIRAAATKSGADQIVAQFPDGYQSMLGHQFIGGQELSGGQWQRFALARFFVRDAPILILDEPLSMIDAVAEEHILKALQAHANGCTVITISHRLSAVRHSDRIFVMDQGRIVESGPHDELVRGGGLYAKMFDAQARNYRKTDDVVP